MRIEATIKYRSVNNCGINIGQGEENDWLNFDSQGNAQATETMRQRLQGLKNGSVISLERIDEKHFTDFSLLKEPEEKKGWDDRDVVGLKDLLDAAHKKGLTGLKTELIHIDYEKKIVHFKAYVYGSGRIFEGSACKEAKDMTPQQQKYWLETVESQAIARALRWFSNTGDVSDIEVGEEQDVKTEEKEAATTETTAG